MNEVKKGLFGVAGYPPNFHNSEYKKDRYNIFEWLNSLGLDLFEAQMTYGPRTKEDNCRKMKELSHLFGITISIHASYFIVFTSDDNEKLKRSADTLIRTFELAELMGAKRIILHPGSLYGLEDAYIKSRFIKNFMSFLKVYTPPSGINIYLETAGKKGQLGSFIDILDMCEELDYCYPCIDFGHVHARGVGALATDSQIKNLFKSMEKYGYKNTSKPIHFHFTTIEYGPKGEIRHRKIDEKIEYAQPDLFQSLKPEVYLPDHKKVMFYLKEANIEFNLISETYNSQDEGALLMKNNFLYEN